MVKSRILNFKPIKFLYLLWQDALRVEIFKDAYAMAYVTLFSLIPSLAAVFALISLFTPLFGENSQLLLNAEDFILKNLATGSGEQVIKYLQGFLANTDFKKIGITGFISTLVTCTLLIQQIEQALNRIFAVKEKRSMLQRFLYFWLILTLGTFCLAVSVGTLSSFAWSSRYFELSLSQKVIREVFYLGGMYLLFLSLYKLGPNRPIDLKKAAIGALVATTLLTQAIRFFSLYITHFTRYQAIYGALAALPIFLFWLYVVWVITLLGALITKRAIDGIPRGSFSTNHIEEDIKPEYFQILLPFLVLMKTYEAYEAAEPCTDESLAKELFVSTTMTRAALSQLQAADLIICKDKNTKKKHHEEFVPSCPAHRLTFAEARERILGNEANWLQSLREESLHADFAYKKAFDAYLTSSKQTLSSLGLKPRSEAKKPSSDAI